MAYIITGKNGFVKGGFAIFWQATLLRLFWFQVGFGQTVQIKSGFSKWNQCSGFWVNSFSFGINVFCILFGLSALIFRIIIVAGTK
jgi:hypothetical protein